MFCSSKVREPMKAHEISLSIRSNVTYLLDFKNTSYIILQDYLTKWIEVTKFKNKTAQKITKNF